MAKKNENRTYVTIECSECKKETYTEKEISDMLNSGEIMLIVLNK